MKENVIALWKVCFTEEIKSKFSEIVVLAYAIADQIFGGDVLLQHPLFQNSKPHVRRDIVDMLLEGLNKGYPNTISCAIKSNIRQNFHYLELILHPFLITQHHVSKMRDNPRYSFFANRYMVNSKQSSFEFYKMNELYLTRDKYFYVQLTHGGNDSLLRLENKPSVPEFIMLGMPLENKRGWWYEEPLPIVECNVTNEEIKDLSHPILNRLRKIQVK